MTEERGSIPPDFGKPDQVLLCELSDYWSIDKHMVKAFMNNYKGEVEYIYQEELKKDFLDKNKYRYKVFDKIVAKTETVSHKLYVQDRITDSLYYCSVSSGFYKKLYRALSIKLEEKRLSQEK